jgi:hypothetical protein
VNVGVGAAFSLISLRMMLNEMQKPEMSGSM